MKNIGWVPQYGIKTVTLSKEFSQKLVKVEYYTVVNTKGEIKIYVPLALQADKSYRDLIEDLRIDEDRRQLYQEKKWWQFWKRSKRRFRGI